MNAITEWVSGHLQVLLSYVALALAVLASVLGLQQAGIKAGIPPLIATVLALFIVLLAGVRLWLINQHSAREQAALIVKRDQLYRSGRGDA